jgi:branched-chain amino acid aminotransferase
MMPPRIKCLSNYQNSRIALMEAKRHGYDSPILLNDRGKVTEGPASCVFVVRDGVAITPSTSSGILESVTRRTVLEMCRDELGIPTEEREMDRSELYVADEAFFCGTGAEIQAISEVDGYRIGTGAIGPVTQRIERHFHDLVRGRTGHASYRIAVYADAAASRTTSGNATRGQRNADREP